MKRTAVYQFVNDDEIQGDFSSLDLPYYSYAGSHVNHLSRSTRVHRLHNMRHFLMWGSGEDLDELVGLRTLAIKKDLQSQEEGEKNDRFGRKIIFEFGLHDHRMEKGGEFWHGTWHFLAVKG
jgi:hypothetical protein